MIGCHWFNGSTGDTIAFSAYDDGADLVETALLVQGMLVARQYFDGTDAVETEIRTRVTRLWEDVEWDWFLNGTNTLYWHWSPTFEWTMNMPIRGYHEGMITYLLAIASPTHAIDSSAYYEGWASSNYAYGLESYGYRQWVGSELGGPIFFTHYSFLDFDPRDRRDKCCSYFDNSRNIALIHQACAIENTAAYEGYGETAWGLTASVNPSGYDAHSSTNDNGTLSPTAALSSIPLTPDESLLAMAHYYEDLGDHLWGEYGFMDAFNLNEDPDWYADTWLAIDQGPIVIMIENYRTGSIWDLFMSNAEIEPALDSIGWASGDGAVARIHQALHTASRCPRRGCGPGRASRYTRCPFSSTTAPRFFRVRPSWS